MKNCIGIIPARYASTRFPGKPLIDIGGMSMIERVYRQAERADLQSIWVATDDQRIFQHVRSFGGNAVMTSPDCANGTERCADALRYIETDAEIVINIQGDEPFIAPAQLQLLASVLQKNTAVSIATLVKKITDSEALFNPNIVKAVVTQQGEVLYFSRQAVPYLRGIAPENWLSKGVFYKHIGLYAYRKSQLPELASLLPDPLETAESLEQLRWLAHGFRIGIAQTTLETIGIDAPEDIEKALAYLRNTL